jgi:hypothetical protein
MHQEMSCWIFTDVLHGLLYVVTVIGVKMSDDE